MTRLGPLGRAPGLVVVVLAAVALAVAAERGGWLRRFVVPAGTGPPRSFVWLDADPRDVRPRAFFLAHELELATVPERATLTALGDGEYVLWLNHRRVGSGRYRAGGRLDRYEVAAWLRQGVNRLVLELRSAIGSGAATLRLVDGEGRILAEAGPEWRVYREAWTGLLEGEELRRGESASVLGREPFGRWGVPEDGPERPLFGDSLGAPRPRRALRYRLPASSGVWTRLPQGDQRRPSLGPLVEFDFGREVQGYLHLAVRSRRTSSGLIRYGSAPSERSGWSPDAIAVVMAGRGDWSDVEPRRFRYVEVAGLDGVLSASVVVIDAESSAALAPQAPAPGLFGIEPPPARLPVEDEIWRRLVSLPRRPAHDAVPRIRSAGAGRIPAPARAPVALRRRAAARAPRARARRDAPPAR